MTLSQIRRLLIVVFICFVAITGGMLGYIKYQASASAELNGFVDITAYNEQEQPAAAVKKELEEGGYKVSVSRVKHKFTKPAGFCLVIRMDKETLKSYLETLKFKGVKASIVDNGDGPAIQYATPFNDRAKAESKAKSITKHAGILFQVEDNFKKVNKQCYCIKITKAPKQAESDISSLLEENKFQDLDSVEIQSEESVADGGDNADKEAAPAKDAKGQDAKAKDAKGEEKSAK